MNLTALRYFHEVAACGSIRQAAERVHIAASALSRQIGNLEHELGARLLERRSTGVSLTAAGEVLARHTQSMFRDIQRLKSDIDDLRDLQRGEIAIATIEGIVGDLLPQIISKFLKQYPHISFIVSTCSSDQAVEKVVLDEVDIGVTYNARPKAEINVALSHVFPTYAVVAPDHELASATVLTVPEVLRYKIALPDRSFGIRRLVDAAALKHQLTIHEFIQTNSFEMMKSFAATGDAVAILPKTMILRELATGQLRAIPVAGDGLAEARIQVCVHQSRVLSSAANRFLTHMVEFLQTNPVYLRDMNSEIERSPEE